MEGEYRTAFCSPIGDSPTTPTTIFEFIWLCPMFARSGAPGYQWNTRKHKISSSDVFLGEAMVLVVVGPSLNQNQVSTEFRSGPMTPNPNTPANASRSQYKWETNVSRWCKTQLLTKKRTSGRLCFSCWAFSQASKKNRAQTPSQSHSEPLPTALGQRDSL